MEQTIYQKLMALGLSKQDIDHHESDLYVIKNPRTTEVIEAHNRTAKVPVSVETFRSIEAVRRTWYSLAFAYDPFWAEIQKA